MTVAGNRLVGNRGYPDIASDFRSTFARMRGIKADVVLPSHAELGNVLDRKARRESGDADAFVAPDLLPRLVDEAEAAFEKELAKEQAQ